MFVRGETLSAHSARPRKIPGWIVVVGENTSVNKRSYTKQTIEIVLRTVPTIVSAHTFCALRKTLFKPTLGLTLTQSTTPLIEAKFSYVDQIKFIEPIRKQGTPK